MAPKAPEPPKPAKLVGPDAKPKGYKYEKKPEKPKPLVEPVAIPPRAVPVAPSVQAPSGMDTEPFTRALGIPGRQYAPAPPPAPAGGPAPMAAAKAPVAAPPSLMNRLAEKKEGLIQSFLDQPELKSSIDGSLKTAIDQMNQRAATPPQTADQLEASYLARIESGLGQWGWTGSGSQLAVNAARRRQQFEQDAIKRAAAADEATQGATRQALAVGEERERLYENPLNQAATIERAFPTGSLVRAAGLTNHTRQQIPPQAWSSLLAQPNPAVRSLWGKVYNGTASEEETMLAWRSLDPAAIRNTALAGALSAAVRGITAEGTSPEVAAQMAGLAREMMQEVAGAPQANFGINPGAIEYGKEQMPTVPQAEINSREEIAKWQNTNRITITESNNNARLESARIAATAQTTAANIRAKAMRDVALINERIAKSKGNGQKLVGEISKIEKELLDLEQKNESYRGITESYASAKTLFQEYQTKLAQIQAGAESSPDGGMAAQTALVMETHAASNGYTKVKKPAFGPPTLDFVALNPKVAADALGFRSTYPERVASLKRALAAARAGLPAGNPPINYKEMDKTNPQTAPGEGDPAIRRPPPPNMGKQMPVRREGPAAKPAARTTPKPTATPTPAKKTTAKPAGSNPKDNASKMKAEDDKLWKRMSGDPGI